MTDQSTAADAPAAKAVPGSPFVESLELEIERLHDLLRKRDAAYCASMDRMLAGANEGHDKIARAMSGMTARLDRLRADGVRLKKANERLKSANRKLAAKLANQAPRKGR
jgi:hypothetical protein